METIDVWDLKVGQRCSVDGREYICENDRQETRPRIGKVWVRTLRGITDPSERKKAIRGFAVEIGNLCLEEMNPAAQLAALRKRKEHKCAGCGEAFTGLATQAKYCSDACRQRAYRERKK